LSWAHLQPAACQNASGTSTWRLAAATCLLTYLEYIISTLDIPLYYVRGNHASKIEVGVHGDRTDPWGAIDLHRKVKRDPSGLLVAGIEGSLQYNYGPHQYKSDRDVEHGLWPGTNPVPEPYALRALPGYLCKATPHPGKSTTRKTGRTRASRRSNWLIKVFQPTYFLHGHVHVYRSDTVTERSWGKRTDQHLWLPRIEAGDRAGKTS